MRADFFGKCADYGKLTQQIQENLVTVTPMTEEELRQAITKPAKQVSLQVEPELVNQMIVDVEGSPGSLPLLQYTLTELWQQRSEEKLTISAYTRLGAVKGTLQKRATEIYESLSPEEQAAAKRIFLELTQLGEGTEDTRRRVLLQDLVTSQPSNNVEMVIQKLADAKLVVTSTLIEKGAELGKVAVVDVAHEALIRHWLLLRKWLDENRDNLREKRKIEAAAEEWLDTGKEKDYLFRGLRLAEAKDFQEKHADTFPLSSLAEEFIFEGTVNPSNESFKTVHISNSDISGFIFNEVHIENSHFSSVDLSGASFAQTNINSAYFEGTDLNRVTFINTNFINAYFNECDLTGTALIKSTLIKAYLEKIDDFNASHNINVNLSGCDLRNINLSGCHLCGAVLSQANLSKANLCEIDLRGTDLNGSDLSEANLNKANLSGTNLSQVNLSKANLSDANLSGANLDGSNLSTANFNKAKLIGARLNGANLQSSELNDADIMACDFNGAINLTPKQVKVAKNWQYAQYDEDFRKQLGLK